MIHLIQNGLKQSTGNFKGLKAGVALSNPLGKGRGK